MSLARATSSRARRLERRVTTAGIIATLLVSSAASSAARQDGLSDRQAIDRAIASVYPALVRISVVTLQWNGGREIKGEASGSGTIVSSDGYVITNHHVAGRVQRIVCTLPSHEEVPAELVGTDPLSDLAVLKLKPATPRTFPTARFGDSTQLRRGDPVLAMGSPLALSQSVTRGIISNTDMVMPQAFSNVLGLLDGEDVGTIVKWIGHDAPIYPGNSGGPLVNLAGEIVGVNEISFGLSGAIPADLAKSVFEAIRRDGRVRRSWTGIEIQPRLSGTAAPGSLVSWVADRSPAAAAGIRTGDVLVGVNGTRIDVQFAEQLPAANRALFELPIGRSASLVFRRDGRDVPITLTPVERPVASSMPAELRVWGIVAANLSAAEARELGRATTDGVRVLNVRPGGPAEQAKPSIGREDVVVEIDGKPVRSLADLQERTAAALGTGERASLLVTYERGLERRVTVVDVSSAPSLTDGGTEARKAWVPVAVQVLTPTLAAKLGLDGKTGVRVTRVIDSSVPLAVGDVIFAIDGEPVRASAATDEDVFSAMIRRFRLGSTVTLTVHRHGSQVQLPVTLALSPKLAREMATYDSPEFEFKARDLVDADASDPRLRGVSGGVIVESVSAGGWAALGRLSVNDIILQVDGRPVVDVEALAARMKEIAASRPKSIVLQVRRGIRTVFLELRPEWK